jgi:tRNA G10  N-methylase Trm11
MFDQDGMKSHEQKEGNPYMLVRKVASGAFHSSIAPKTRICITRTPLCPLASFIMCNLAQIKEGDSILDPYAGSCSTLLAASMVVPSIQSVGIEIADNNSVNRDDILKDFESRGLSPPKHLLHGDSLDSDVRDIARAAIGNVPFDAIIADPPYGRREKYSAKKDIPPLIKFIECIKADYEAGKPLLKRGGRFVAFVPTNEGESVYNGIPSMDDLELAGLKIESLTEQPLSGTLSRWLLVLRCTR